MDMTVEMSFQRLLLSLLLCFPKQRQWEVQAWLMMRWLKAEGK